MRAVRDTVLEQKTSYGYRFTFHKAGVILYATSVSPLIDNKYYLITLLNHEGTFKLYDPLGKGIWIFMTELQTLEEDVNKIINTWSTQYPSISKTDFLITFADALYGDDYETKRNDLYNEYIRSNQDIVRRERTKANGKLIGQIRRHNANHK